MVEAARKYKRVVQAGTLQRARSISRKADQNLRAGSSARSVFSVLGIRHVSRRASAIHADSDPLPNLDWDMWLGPAPKRPFNAEPIRRHIENPERRSSFRTSAGFGITRAA